MRYVSMDITVAVLFASSRSVYHFINNVEVYDKKRDAMTFTGNMPIVAHPPCRPWSAFTKHQAHFTQAEKEYAPWAITMLKKCGGVLEHPAYSRLWEALDLPRPGQRTGDLWCEEVWQHWWGFPTQKKTWLLFCRIDPSCVSIPLRLYQPIKKFKNLSRRQRSSTTPIFAQWLVDVAKKCTMN